MRSLLKFLFAALILAAVIYAIRLGKLNSADGKLAGVAADEEGFGKHEIVTGLILAGGLWAGAAALRMAKLGKFAPAVQAPTGG